jgi:hypothetical protein
LVAFRTCKITACFSLIPVNPLIDFHEADFRYVGGAFKLSTRTSSVVKDLARKLRDTHRMKGFPEDISCGT